MQTLNQKGIALPFLALVLAFFVFRGLWYIYKSYEKKQLKENLSQVYFDYRSRAVTAVKDTKDRKRVEGLFREVDGIVAKYHTGSTALPFDVDTTKR